MSKIIFDKYYTDHNLAKYCVDKTIEVVGIDNITHVLEPSAGNGSFIHPIKDKFESYSFYDISPEHDEITKCDYLELDREYTKGSLVIGNPPFGNRNTLIVKFFNKSVEICDYISFILPISQLNNQRQLYKFDLIYSEDLGVMDYSGVRLHCCLNIYKRPPNNLNKAPKNIVIDGLEIIEYRRDKNDSYRSKIKDGYFHAIGSWGDAVVGKKPEYIGRYALELYFYTDDDGLKNIIMDIDWESEIKGISMKRLPKYKALEIIKSRLL